MTLLNITKFEKVRCDFCDAIDSSISGKAQSHLPVGWITFEVREHVFHLCAACTMKPKAYLAFFIHSIEDTITALRDRIKKAILP